MFGKKKKSKKYNDEDVEHVLEQKEPEEDLPEDSDTLENDDLDEFIETLEKGTCAICSKKAASRSAFLCKDHGLEYRGIGRGRDQKKARLEWLKSKMFEKHYVEE